MIQVLAVDANRTALTGIRQLIEWQPDTLVLAAAYQRAFAVLEALDALTYDVALIDPSIRGGLELIRTLFRRYRHRSIVAFSVQCDAPSLFDAIEAGARGYLLKSTEPTELVRALVEAARGGAPLSPPVARTLLEHLRRPPGLSSTPPPKLLTPRELEVLSELARGATYAETAARLGIGLGTVQSHVKSIYRKLEVGSKTQAAALALSRGLVSLQ